MRSGSAMIIGGMKQIAKGVLRSMFIDYRRLMFWFDSRDWQVDFTISGKKGEVKQISTTPQCYFRGEKLMATDKGLREPGCNTRIVGILVGHRLQVPFVGNGGTLTMFFAQNALGNGIAWDICDPAFSITLSVEFLEDAEFMATCFGKAAFWP